MKNIRKHMHKGVLIAAVCLAAIAPAGRAHAVSTAELMALIQELMRQVETLQRQVRAMGTTGEQVRFLFDIQYGVRGSSEVRALQQFLIDRGYLARDLATGNFFALTRDALRRFQGENAIPMTGILDAKTREVINGMVQVQSQRAEESVPIIKMASTTPAVQVSVRPEYQVDPRPAYDVSMMERLAFDMVNAERQKNGLNVLVWNEQAAMVARAHSMDQAGDNTVITNGDVACLYPFIRHEGFVAGFKVGDRLERAGVDYRLAGENIIIFPMTKELIYQAEKTAPACIAASETEGVLGEAPGDANIRIQKMLNERVNLMEGQQALNWVNREWKTPEEMASESATEWMNSPGHRRNILTAEFAEGGMGGAIVNDYIILTQVFLKRP